MSMRFRKSDYIDACSKGEHCINPKCCEMGKKNRKKIEQYESDLYRIAKTTTDIQLKNAYLDLLSEVMNARIKREKAEGFY